jgi:hypothetical protein
MTSSQATRPRPVRWAIALLVTVAMLVATTGVVVFAQTGSSGGPAFAPATSVLWAELRLDLPGSQEEELSELLGHLPGFADPAALDAKVNELLDQVVSQASSGGASWTGDIDPWSNRQFGLALLEIPEGATMSAGATSSPTTGQLPPSMVIGLGVKDRAALESRLASFLTQEPIATEQYAGATVTTVGDDVSYAVTDQYLLVAPAADDVKASLDVLAGNAPGLVDDPSFAAAAARIPADRLGAFYFAVSALRPLMESQLTGQPGTELVLDMLDQLPTWVSGYAQASSDHLTLAVDLQTPPSFPVPSMRETDLASRFPAGTFVYLEIRDLGSTLHAALETVLAQVPAESTEDIAQLERLLGAPLPALLDPVEDAALGVSFADGTFAGGIAATLSDVEAAQTRVNNLVGLIRLMSAAGDDPPFTITEADVAGVPVTTFTFEDGAGMSAFAAPIQPSISVAVSADHLYLGVGDFVETALTQDAATSLASDTRYANALTVAGSPNAGMAYIDIAGVQSLIEGMGGADERYTTDVKPWLDALDYLVLSNLADDDSLSSKLLVFVR